MAAARRAEEVEDCRFVLGYPKVQNEVTRR